MIGETSCEKIRLSKRYDGRRIPMYRFNFTNGCLRTNHNGYTRFYANIDRRVRDELDTLRNELKDISHQFLETKTNRKALFGSKDGPRWDNPSFELSDLAVSDDQINFRINNWSKFRIQTQTEPYRCHELHLDSIRDITTFNGSLVISIPWINYFAANPNKFEPYTLVNDLLITDVLRFNNPHLTPQFFSQVQDPMFPETMHEIISYNQVILSPQPSYVVLPYTFPE